MQDLDAAVAAGLVIPTEATCTGCHNSESPTFPGSFNYEEMKAAGVHEIGG
jgi:3-hydroxymyristoyl/3-hydroxydecanoyl-(acyl carrier protein) dehydratase